MLRKITSSAGYFMLQRLLDGDRMRTSGAIENLLHFAQTNAPTGAVGIYPDEEIEAFIGWPGATGELVAMLVKTRFLEPLPGPGRLYVAGWHEHHADRAVHMKLGRGGLFFANGTMPTLSHLPKEEREAAARKYAVYTDEAQRTHGGAEGPGARGQGPAAVGRSEGAEANHRSRIVTRKAPRTIRNDGALPRSEEEDDQDGVEAKVEQLRGRLRDRSTDARNLRAIVVGLPWAEVDRIAHEAWARFRDNLVANPTAYFVTSCRTRAQELGVELRQVA